MSKQLSVSATASVLAMALFALVASLSGNSAAPMGSGQIAAPVISIAV